MWRLALMVTAQLVLLSSADESNPCIPGDFAFQPQQAAGPATCTPTLPAALALIQDENEERQVIYSGPCGGSYKKDDGTNKCCDQNERPECYSDGGCTCSYDPYCQSLCQPSGTCQQHDC